MSHRVVGDPDRGPFLFTCEHASNRLVGVVADEADAALLAEHWGYDLGAAALTEALAARTGSAAVLSDFSRLLVDPNRPLHSPTLIVTACAGQPVSFNQGLTAAEISQRIAALYAPYHAAVAQAAARRLARGPATLVSIHSFTPVYQGHRRPMEVGVLFDDCEAEARRLASALSAQGLVTALNAPYSGRDGLIYSVERHGRAVGAPHLELEIRQDLLSGPEAVSGIAGRITAALSALT